MQEAPALQGDIGRPYQEGLPRAVGQGEEVIAERSKNSIKITVTDISHSWAGRSLQKVLKTVKKLQTSVSCYQ